MFANLAFLYFSLNCIFLYLSWHINNFYSYVRRQKRLYLSVVCCCRVLFLSSFMVGVDISKSTTCLHFHALIYSKYDIVKRFPRGSCTAELEFEFIIWAWVQATAKLTFRGWPTIQKKLKTHIFPNYCQIKAFLQQNIYCYLFINGSKPIFYCLICVQMSKTYCKQTAHGCMFLEGKFSNLLPVPVCLKQSRIKYNSLNSLDICGFKWRSLWKPRLWTALAKASFSLQLL